ncbi:hypothetical protein Pelo_2849 [Pelomyxa schiedti]|nr:hypothetical protein Pelo_2849 [Pelomyxa schiedti]
MFLKKNKSKSDLKKSTASSPSPSPSPSPSSSSSPSPSSTSSQQQQQQEQDLTPPTIATRTATPPTITVSPSPDVTNSPPQSSQTSASPEPTSKLRHSSSTTTTTTTTKDTKSTPNKKKGIEKPPKRTPLCQAAWKGDEATLRSMLESGCDPNDDPKPPPTTSANSGSETASTSPEDPGTGNGGNEHEEGMEPLRLMTPLHAATYKGHAACVRLLLDHGADPNRTVKNPAHGITAMYNAATNAASGGAKAGAKAGALGGAVFGLFGAGAGAAMGAGIGAAVCAATVCSGLTTPHGVREGDTPLHIAARIGKLGVVAILAPVTNLTVRNGDGKGPIDVAHNAVRQLIIDQSYGSSGGSTSRNPPSSPSPSLSSETSSSPKEPPATRCVAPPTPTSVQTQAQLATPPPAVTPASPSPHWGTPSLPQATRGPQQPLIQQSQEAQPAVEQTPTTTGKPKERSMRCFIPESETTEYKGALVIPDKPTKSCAEVLTGNEDIGRCVPFLSRIIPDCELIMSETILQRESARHLITEHHLTDDEVLALIVYSYDVRPLGGSDTQNFFFQLNEVLRKRGASFEGWRGYIHYLMSALRKLPSYSGVVYRGSNNPTTARPYTRGTSVVWSAFSSTSALESVARDFAGTQGALFCIEITNGKDISAFSAIASEKEVLLPPNAKFVVTKGFESSNTGPYGVCEIHLLEVVSSFKW